MPKVCHYSHVVETLADANPTLQAAPAGGSVGAVQRQVETRPGWALGAFRLLVHVEGH